jgi:hypothetical protein
MPPRTNLLANCHKTGHLLSESHSTGSLSGGVRSVAATDEGTTMTGKLNVVVSVDVDFALTRIEVRGMVTELNVRALYALIRRANITLPGLTSSWTCLQRPWSRPPWNTCATAKDPTVFLLTSIPPTPLHSRWLPPDSGARFRNRSGPLRPLPCDPEQDGQPQKSGCRAGLAPAETGTVQEVRPSSWFFLPALSGPLSALMASPLMANRIILLSPNSFQ